METILYWITRFGYLGIFSLLMLGIVGLPVPDEVLLTFAGYLVFKGNLRLVPTMAAAFLGSMSGISLSYYLGRTVGIYLIHKYGHLLHITADKVNQVHRWYNRVGKWTLFFGYYVPGVRHLTAYVAGILNLPVPVFALFAYAGGFVWSATFISLGYFLGERWVQVSKQIHHGLIIAFAVVGVFLLIYFLLQQRKQKPK